jgi:hypothetical protein
MYVESNSHFQTSAPTKAFMKHQLGSPPLPVEWSTLGGGIAGILPSQLNGSIGYNNSGVSA